MPAPKPPEPPSGKQVSARDTERKPWKKKTPVEVVLEQEKKLRQEIAETERELQQKRSQLAKFEQARKIFEGS
ncbi:MAG TPA: hypothetical protein VHU83_11545 [Bryobacteraceae bacterium]|jgi:flagellar biosynthesis GTPase FlhF|nr:hypothetical protein [Bryobacteraceae bacterium]